MRGLTREERELLLDYTAPAVVYAGFADPDYERIRVARRMISQGRVALTGRKSYITDLGRLALRVCPVEEE